MYKVSIHCLLFFIFQSSFAQPVLTSSNINPILGDQYVSYSSAELADTSQIGMNITWDYTGIIPFDTVVMVANSTAGTNIPSASIRYSDLLFQSSNYYNTSPSSLEFAGFDSFGNIMIYNDPEKMIKYPFQYNDTLMDYYFRYQVGTSHYRYGMVYSKADGYGTLKLPSGVFNNALRVKTDFHGKDSNNGIVTAADFIMIRWYVPGIHVPVAEAFEYINGQATPSFQYIGTMATNTEDIFYSDDIKIYPNPSNTIINIKISNSKFQNATKKLYNSIGQLLFATDKNDIDVTKYSKGIYYLKCGYQTKKIIIE